MELKNNDVSMLLNTIEWSLDNSDPTPSPIDIVLYQSKSISIYYTSIFGKFSQTASIDICQVADE